MIHIASKVKITLRIPPHFKNLTGKAAFVQEFIPGEPVEVPEAIAAYYTKAWPAKFRYAAEPVEEIEKEEEPLVPKEFDPVEFLLDNEGNYLQALTNLSRKDLNSVAKELKLRGFYQQKTEHVIERVLNDIKIQMEKEKQE